MNTYFLAVVPADNPALAVIFAVVAPIVGVMTFVGWLKDRATKKALARRFEDARLAREAERHNPSA